MHLPVPAGGRGHGDGGAPRHDGGHRVHEDRGGIGRAAPGHVHAHALDGLVLLAQADARTEFFDPARAHLLPVIGFDILLRFPEHREEIVSHGGGRLFDFLFTHAEVRKVRPVELFREAAHRFVAVQAYILQNHRRGALHFRRKIHRTVREPPDFPERQALFGHLDPFHAIAFFLSVKSAGRDERLQFVLLHLVRHFIADEPRGERHEFVVRLEAVLPEGGPRLNDIHNDVR